MTEPAVTAERAQIIRAVFPQGLPELWCPLLTHYRDENATPDLTRIKAHLAHLSPFVKAFLAPGSTGDGWEMSAGLQRELVHALLEIAEELELWIMIGVLRTEPGAAREAMLEMTSELLGGRTPDDPRACARALAERRVCGFTVTPPRGATLTERQIHAELAAVAELGLPVAFYQLPQITENEVTPASIAGLAAEHPNFYLFKDTSGGDRVALAEQDGDQDYGNLFLVRGAELEYASWHRTADGPYDGFLLSTMNCFAPMFAEMLAELKAGRRAAAESISARVSAVAEELFGAAAQLPYGNPFSNANRAIDHVFAYGTERATTLKPPLTISGNRLPRELIAHAADALGRNHLVPENGYLP